MEESEGRSGKESSTSGQGEGATRKTRSGEEKRGKDVLLLGNCSNSFLNRSTAGSV